jgi:2-polyprenyl-6-methoxyphenol hydroxylase-like FAD-dependent oxidoreductase
MRSTVASLTGPLYTMPVTQRWTAHHNLTLVGDAAHVMPPFSGQGANMALRDTVKLIDALLSAGPAHHHPR